MLVAFVHQLGVCFHTTLVLDAFQLLSFNFPSIPSCIWSASSMWPSWRLILTWFSPDVYSVYSLWCYLFYLSFMPFNVHGPSVGSSKTVPCLLSCHTEVAVGTQFKGSMVWICSVVILGKVLKVWSNGSVLGFVNVCLFMCSVIKWGDPSSEELRAIIDCAVGYLQIVFPKRWLL